MAKNNDDTTKMWLSWNGQWGFAAQRIPTHFAKGAHNNHVWILGIQTPEPHLQKL